MLNTLQTGIGEALQLTREGRLTEATAAIQRALRSSTPVTTPAADISQPLDVVAAAVSLVNEPPSPWQDALRTTVPMVNTSPSNPPVASSGGHEAASSDTMASNLRNSEHWQGTVVGLGTPTAGGGLPFRTSPALPSLEYVPTTRLEPRTFNSPRLPLRVPLHTQAITSAPPTARFVERSYTNRAGTRAYKLYIPSGYHGQAVPLVIMLHGCTQTPDDFAAGTRMNILAEDHTFLVAYPAQSSQANGSKCWNWFKSSEQQREAGEPLLIAGITQQIMQEYHVDVDRVYVAGLSAGGAMAVIMGTAYPDLYAALGVHSGLAYGVADDVPSAFEAMHRGRGRTLGTSARSGAPSGAPDRVIPMIVFHGDRDTTVHPRNSEQILSQAVSKIQMGGPGAGEPPRSTVRTHQGHVPDGHDYRCTTYRDAADRVVLEHWTLHGATHAWSGGSPMGSYTDPQGPDASAEMVRFFREHPRPGAS